MNKEKIILAALELHEYERKQIALVLLGSMLTDMAEKEAISIMETNRRSENYDLHSTQN